MKNSDWSLIVWGFECQGKFLLNFGNKRKLLEVSELRSETTEAGLWNLIPAAVEHGLVSCHLWSWKMSYYNKTFNNVAVTVTRFFPNSDLVTPLEKKQKIPCTIHPKLIHLLKQIYSLYPKHTYILPLGKCPSPFIFQLKNPYTCLAPGERPSFKEQKAEETPARTSRCRPKKT